jgi:voltage-gated cation channel
MKVLRPLRVISRNQGLRISIRVMAVAIGSIINVVIVSLLFYAMFGIIGVNYFKGKYFDCDVAHIKMVNLDSKIDHKWECLSSGGEWVKEFMNFDSTLSAMQTIFMMSNTVMWSDVMYRGATARAIDYTASDQIESVLAALFFVLIIVIGNFFLMNLFVGVIITTYNREKEIMGKDFMLTEEQKKWRRKSMMMLLSQPMFKMKIPHSEWRQPFYFICQSVFMQYFILTCILMNTIILILQWINQSE